MKREKETRPIKPCIKPIEDTRPKLDVNGDVRRGLYDSGSHFYVFFNLRCDHSGKKSLVLFVRINETLKRRKTRLGKCTFFVAA